MDKSKFSKKELKQIKKLGVWAEFNKRGHLVFRQRYPMFPLYLSIFALCLSLIASLF